MQPLKYKINDRVKERTSNKVHGGFVNNKRKYVSVKSKRGVIKGVVIKKNREKKEKKGEKGENRGKTIRSLGPIDIDAAQYANHCASLLDRLCCICVGSLCGLRQWSGRNIPHEAELYKIRESQLDCGEDGDTKMSGEDLRRKLS